MWLSLSINHTKHSFLADAPYVPFDVQVTGASAQLNVTESWTLKSDINMSYPAWDWALTKQQQDMVARLLCTSTHHYERVWAELQKEAKASTVFSPWREAGQGGKRISCFLQDERAYKTGCALEPSTSGS